MAIVVEIGGAFLLIVGWKVRFAAVALAGHCVGTALLFHASFTDRAQKVRFLKNVALAGSRGEGGVRYCLTHRSGPTAAAPGASGANPRADLAGKEMAGARKASLSKEWA